MLGFTKVGGAWGQFYKPMRRGFRVLSRSADTAKNVYGLHRGVGISIPQALQHGAAAGMRGSRKALPYGKQMMATTAGKLGAGAAFGLAAPTMYRNTIGRPKQQQQQQYRY